MRKRRSWSAFAAAAFLIVALSPGLASADGTGKSGPVIRLGQILGVGKMDARGCRFDEPIEITQDMESDESESKFVALSVSKECRVQVVGTWHGNLADGPAEVSRELAAVIAGQGRIDPLDDLSSNPDLVPLSTSGCKSISQTAWMYGFGGTGDDLTRVANYTDFCWDAGEVWKTNGGGGCGGSSPLYWTWVRDSCTWPGSTWGPSRSNIYGTIRGAFHCSPTNVPPCSIGGGYDHQLYAKNTAYPTGSSSCTYWFTGQIVNGMTHSVVRCSG